MCTRSRPFITLVLQNELEGRVVTVVRGDSEFKTQFWTEESGRFTGTMRNSALAGRLIRGPVHLAQPHWSGSTDLNQLNPDVGRFNSISTL